MAYTIENNETEKYLNVQEQQLKRWESVLKKSVMIKLKLWVLIQNEKAERPRDIPRGVDLQMYISNHLMK